MERKRLLLILGLVGCLSGCGGVDTDLGDLNGRWQFQMQHDGDSCNSPHPATEVFEVNLQHNGKRLVLPSAVRLDGLYGLQLTGIAADISGSSVDWTGSAAVTTSGGCSLTGTLTATGVARGDGQTINQITGVFDLSLTKTPADCVVQGYCRDARYVYGFTR